MYLDGNTLLTGLNQKQLEAFYEGEKTITEGDFVEELAEQMLDGTGAAPNSAAMLAVGDAFGATVHTES